MNIVILCYHRIGGSGILAYEIGRAMAEVKGHQVHFMGLEPPFRLKDNESDKIQFHKVWVKEYPVFDFQPYDLALASQLSEIIQRYQIDVIHSHYALPHAVAALLARDISKRKVKCLTTLHGTDITIVGAHPSMIHITRWAIENSDVVTAVSEDLKRETVAKLNIAPEKIQTVYNFVNTQNFYPNPNNRYPCTDKGKTIVLHVSNLREVKCPIDVIRIFYGIVNSMDCPVELWVIGEGPLESEMVKETQILGIEDKVRFIGVRSNLGFLIAQAHLLLLPSKKESFGLAALEAMACGVPVVASRVGGLPEVIEDGVNGFLFTFGDIQEAVNKSVQVLQDHQLHSRIRQAALQTVKDRFPLEKIVDQFEQLYLS